MAVKLVRGIIQRAWKYFLLHEQCEFFPPKCEVSIAALLKRLDPTKVQK